jgi:hypothetical protein
MITHNDAKAFAFGGVCSVEARSIELQRQRAVNLREPAYTRATTNFRLVQRTNEAPSYFHPNACVD